MNEGQARTNGTASQAGPEAVSGEGQGGSAQTEAQTEAQTDAQKKLHDLLAGLWQQRKSVLQERLQVLESAVRLLQDGGGQAAEARTAGADAAHKLAGILGTFGLPRGTDLAREAELMLEKDGPIVAEDLQRLRVLTEELGRLIDQPSLPRGR